MARYHFVTEFSLTADRPRVWDALSDPRDWPSWWRWLKPVDVHDEGGKDRLGASYTYLPRRRRRSTENEDAQIQSLATSDDDVAND